MTQYKIYTTGGVLDKVMHTKLVAYTDSMSKLREFIASYTLSVNYAALRKSQRVENNDPRITLVPEEEFIITMKVYQHSLNPQPKEETMAKYITSDLHFGTIIFVAKMALCQQGNILKQQKK